MKVEEGNLTFTHITITIENDEERLAILTAICSNTDNDRAIYDDMDAATKQTLSFNKYRDILEDLTHKLDNI